MLSVNEVDFMVDYMRWVYCCFNSCNLLWLPGDVRMYYSILPGSVSRIQDANVILATPGVSFVGATNAFVDFSDGQKTAYINVTLLDYGTPFPSQALVVNLTNLVLLSAINGTFSPVFCK